MEDSETVLQQPSSKFCLQPLVGGAFPDSQVISVDKGNCAVLLIGHHTDLSSPSVIQRPCQAQDADPQSKATCETTEVSVSSCHRHIPLCLQQLPPLSTSEVKSTPPPLSVYQGLTREPEDSFRTVAPKEAWGPRGAIDCQHDRLLVSNAKEKEKRDPRGSHFSAADRPSLRALGLASQDLAMASVEG